MRLESGAFRMGSAIPKKYACEGENTSPPLNFSDIPPKTKSLALVCDDPDAPMGTFVHWVLWNIRPDMKGIGEGESAKVFCVEGSNDFGRAGYGGPCPPRGHGPHRYFFKLYALDSMLSLNPGATEAELENAMKGHILEKAELMGTYERK
ncbi:MAG: YbhB/YbcL family Raf kinase inhibitor-like protein [Candidatus Micrarchaeota archaeon]